MPHALLLLAPPLWPVPAHVGYDSYTLFYVLAFSLNLGLLVWEGHRRGYPLRPWLVLLACSTLAFILGTKLLAFSGPDWQLLLRTGQWPVSEARTVLGGALAGTLTLLALRRPFGFSWHVFDAFTVPMCAALMVQCVGCALTGCCFGHPTGGSWGFTYPPDTLPYLVQVDRGLLPVGAAHSLPVHPTQLYTLLVGAAVGSLLLLTRHRPWPGGNRRLLHLGLLLAGRFVIEFWRDPAGEQVGAAVRLHGGLALKQVQWALLLLAPLVWAGWATQLYRAQHSAPAPEQLPRQNSRRNLLAVALLLALTAWLGPWALTLPEVLVIKALLLAVLGLEGAQLLRGALVRPRPARLALPLVLVGVVLVLTSQAAADSTRATRAAYTTLGLGLSAGSFERNQNTDGGCGGSTPLLHYRHRYQLATLDAAHTVLPGTAANGKVHKAEITAGLRLHLGGDQQTQQFTDPLLGSGLRKNTLLISANPYLQIDRSWFGLGLGLMVGNLGYHKYTFGDEISSLDLQSSVRIGPRQILYAQADYNYLGYGTGNPQQRLGLGTGFGGTRWELRTGAATAKNYALPAGQRAWSGFVEAQALLTPQWQAGTFLTFGNPHQQQVGLRVGHRFLRRQ
ncbi:prolipoprotein diacylglyceryl transferase family protein [Hymenobacter chitinivorans]|uniref:Phosphatidylglycerol:prolipoprotein diacylglycerol transferase n=1 Tax=Hymenobacter chitinivorans DSM 11115 TaxID=1121954 RepID=A0A2M9BPD6_9BACT|nr:prolipoprotein diacylglyceryl transferase family protein [Hymenobacter chitinivorans]PJJ59815.1 phosphatidylglycerol:prolipoprotein diacylglycerol transferase [Hymenobacter chitinivorans DSM 11115]